MTDSSLLWLCKILKGKQRGISENKTVKPQQYTSQVCKAFIHLLWHLCIYKPFYSSVVTHLPSYSICHCWFKFFPCMLPAPLGTELNREEMQHRKSEESPLLWMCPMSASVHKCLLGSCVAWWCVPQRRPEDQDCQRGFFPALDRVQTFGLKGLMGKRFTTWTYLYSLFRWLLILILCRQPHIN